MPEPRAWRMEMPTMKQVPMASNSPMLPAEGEPAARRAVLTRPARAHITPMMLKIHSFTACTLTPDRRVASMLLPTA